jgi:hypothetical protein
MRTLNDLISLSPLLAAAGQQEYDVWEQDEEGYHEELGSGGICHLIADRMVGILSDEGFEAVSTHSEGIGEDHVWVTAQTAQGVVTVDIPPGVYEIGGGYTWKKRPDIVFVPSDIVVDVIDKDPLRFPDYAGKLSREQAGSRRHDRDRSHRMTEMVTVTGVFMDVAGKPFNADRTAVRLLNRMMAAEEHLTVRLPISRMIATQDSVNDDFRGSARQVREDGYDLPCVVKYNGRYYVTDGHHRLMDLAAEGISSPEVRLYDLDGDTQLNFPLLDGLDDEDDAANHGIPFRR